MPAVLRQDWQADVALNDLPALGTHETRIQLSFGYDTPTEWIQTGIFSDNVAQVQHSSAFADGLEPAAARGRGNLRWLLGG